VDCSLLQTDRLIQGMILQRNQYELVDFIFDIRVKTDRGAGMETIITVLVVDISNNVRNL
jgi:hypothetical protein